jgi:hypothetical protein
MRCSASVGWAMSRQEGRGGRTRALSGPTYFGPKSEAEMGAHGQARTALFVWVGPLGCGFPIFLSTRTLWTRGSRLGRPAGDALRFHTCAAVPRMTHMFLEQWLRARYCNLIQLTINLILIQVNISKMFCTK